MNYRFTLIIILFSTITFAQNQETNFIKDYFLPSKGNNKSVYFTPYPETGERTGMSNIEWYFSNSDETYEVLSGSFFNDQTNSIFTKIIKITDDEIKIIETTSTNPFETNRKKTYYPARVYMIMPKGKTKSTWVETDAAEETYICSSEWTVVNIDGNNKKTIKVKRQLKDKEWAIKTEYYVQGIGLWKITVLKEEKDLWILDYQEYQNRFEN